MVDLAAENPGTEFGTTPTPDDLTLSSAPKGRENGTHGTTVEVSMKWGCLSPTLPLFPLPAAADVSAHECGFRFGVFKCYHDQQSGTPQGRTGARCNRQPYPEGKVNLMLTNSTSSRSCVG
jgi:hypothetical protein